MIRSGWKIIIINYLEIEIGIEEKKMSYPFRILENKKKYRYVIHLSDIHIRTGDLDKCRYDEYHAVFEEFARHLQGYPYKEQSVIVMTGDIFHHKGKIEPAGIRLAQDFMDVLLQEMDVLLICGNHDYRQDNPRIPDMIETIYKNYICGKTGAKNRLYYLCETGYYQYGNIGFGVMDVRDALKGYNTFGRKEGEELDVFPPVSFWKDKKFVKHQIGLFHGTILPSRLMNNLQLADGYELSWFGEYPYLLLGDNHRFQCNREGGMMWGYAGSFIQQDFGESYAEHGYVVWDLKEKKAEHNEVKNRHGFCTLKHHQGKLYIHRKLREWTPLEEGVLPENPSLRVFDKKTQELVKEECKKLGVVPRCIQIWKGKEKEMGMGGEGAGEEGDEDREGWMTHLEELNSREKWVEYISRHDEGLCGMILTPESMKLPETKGLDFLRKHHERNDKIQKALDEFLNESGKSERHVPRVELINMSWSYLMCYGSNNYFNFETVRGKIALLNGKNAMGKSSFLDILCIGLFGEPTKMRNLVNGKKYTDKIIHDQRPSNRSAPFVKLMFRVGDKVYEIHRTFGTQSAKTKEHLILQTSILLYEVGAETKRVVYEGSTLVDKWVEENIGTMESVLMSSMVCQIDLNNFFHLKQDEQKNLLDKALRLENVSLYGKVIKESILAHQDILSQIKTAMETMTNLQDKGEVLDNEKEKEITKELQDCQASIEKLEKHRDMYKQHISRSNQERTKDNIPEDIEGLYREAEMKYLLHHGRKDIREKDIEEYYRHKERLSILQQQYTEGGYHQEEAIEGAKELYMKWKKKYDGFLKKEPTCEVSKEWMEETQKAYDDWLEEWKDVDIKDDGALERERWEKAKESLLSFVMMERPSSRYRGGRRERKERLPMADEEYHSLKEKYHKHLGCGVPPSHQYDKEKHEKWVEEYQDWLRVFEACIEMGEETVVRKLDELDKSLSCYQEKEQELIEVSENLREMEHELEGLREMEFNPTCWACQKNPYKRKKIETTDAYEELKGYCKELQRYIQKIQKGSGKGRWEEKRDLYRRFLAEKEDMDTKNMYWEVQVRMYRVFQEWCETKELLEREIEEEEEIRYEEQVRERERLVKECQEAERVAVEASRYLEEKKRWDKALRNMERYKESYELYKVWCEEHEIIKQKVERYKRAKEKQEMEMSLCETRREYEELQDSVQYHLEYMRYRSMYYEKKLEEVEEEIAGVLVKRQGLLDEKARIEAQIAIYKQRQDTFESLQRVEKEYMARLERIRRLDTLFMGDKTTSDGYKEWIYKQQVIPLLNDEMNRFLQMFESFTFEMMYDKKSFIYMIEDRGNKPTLDKASGYQNFIVSLALRIVLARIGAVGQQLKHLFIDEGFTACDSSNIEKVPILLENICKYGEYQSILLMSHLESVRDCSQASIQIERVDPFSSITFGKEYPDIPVVDTKTGEVIVKKQRGRPKKS